MDHHGTFYRCSFGAPTYMDHIVVNWHAYSCNAELCKMIANLVLEVSCKLKRCHISGYGNMLCSNVLGWPESKLITGCLIPLPLKPKSPILGWKHRHRQQRRHIWWVGRLPGFSQNLQMIHIMHITWCATLQGQNLFSLSITTWLHCVAKLTISLPLVC